MTNKDLHELDKLILKLSKTELLKVQLHEQTGGIKSWPTSSILLESNNHNSRMHRSHQYNVPNTELEEEKKQRLEKKTSLFSNREKFAKDGITLAPSAKEVLNQCMKTLKK